MCEGDRWVELVFALLTRVAKIPETELRMLANRCRDLGLLDVEVLADASKHRTR